MGDENPIHTLGDYSKPSHEGYRNTIVLPVGNNVVPLRSDTIWLVQNGCSFHELWSEDPNQHLKDFLKLMDSINLDGENRERTLLRLFQFSLRDQASNWLERLPAGSITTLEDLTTHFLAQLFLTKRTAKLRNDILIWNDPRDFAKPVNAIALPQDVLSTSDRLHNTQYCMEDPAKAFVEYASSRTDEAGYTRLSKFEADFKQQQSEMTYKINTVLKDINDRIAGALPSDTIKNPKLSTSLVLSARSYPNMDPQCSNHIQAPDPSVAFITEKVLKFNSFFESLGLVPRSSDTEVICTKWDDGEVMFIELIRKNDDSSKGEPGEEGNTITKGVGAEYFNIFPTRSELTYHKKLNSRENSNRGVSNFIGRIKGMHVFVGSFTYIIDFMIIEDISSIIDPRTDEVAYKMPHIIKKYNSLSDLEKEHTKSIYLRNEEDKRRGVEYVMSRILGFYKECLELGPKYVTGMDDEGEVT
ncbi:hypothetical protein Tco_1001012 [Tanacetum coccineum]